MKIDSNLLPFLHRESDPEVGDLRRAMDAFYSRPVGYIAFEAPSQQAPFWAPIITDIAQRISQSSSCRILEFGAGRTGFPGHLGELRGQVHVSAQDVTSSNIEYLHSCCDQVFIGDINQVEGQFDVIFSTFVWEHMTSPAASLQHLQRLLAPGGTLYIASPRYDCCFYVPPSARNYSFSTQFRLSVMLVLRRLAVRLGGPPDFLIHTDPAVLKMPWYRDADAVHWVSRGDIRRAVGAGWDIEDIPMQVNGLRAMVWIHFMLLFVRIRAVAGNRPD
jgi:SAM-dependent methyltransferase